MKHNTHSVHSPASAPRPPRPILSTSIADRTRARLLRPFAAAALGWCAFAATPAWSATYSYVGPPVAIPDAADLSGTNPGAAVFAPLMVAGAGGVISNVIFRFDGAISSAAGNTSVGLDHTFVNDLRITLMSPNGTSVLLINNADGSGNNFAQTILDDTAAVNIQTAVTAQAPFNGTWAPNSPLAAFNGGVADGLWQLMVQDFFSSDTGSIRLWSIDLTSAVLNTGALLQNSAPVGIPTTANFIVDGPVETGGPTEDNLVNSLTFLPGSSLKIFNTLTVTQGPVELGDRSSIDLHGTLMASQLNVLPGGTLGGNGTIDGHLVNTGLVSPGSSPGKISVTGNFTQGASGALRIEVGGSGPGEFDQLEIGGSAQLDGTVQLVRLNNFRLKRGDTITFLTATQGVSGEFATVVSEFTSDTILVPTVVYHTDSVALEMAQGSFAEFAAQNGLTPNQRAVAGALDSVAFGSTVPGFIDFLDEQPIGNLPSQFDQIAPEELTGIFNIANALANVQITNLQRRLEDVRGGSTGFSGQRFALQGSTTDFQGGFGLAGVTGPDGKTGKTCCPMVPAPENRWGFFVNGTGEFVDVENDGNANGFDFQSGGLTFGVDYRVCANFAVGFTVGYAHTGADLADQGKVSIDGGRIGLYATAFGNGFYLDGAVSAGLNGYETRRSALQGSARGGPNGTELDAFIGGGYDWKFGALTVGPTASFQYTSVNLDGFTERGSLAPLAFDDQSGESIRTNLGVKVSYDWKWHGHLIRPELRVAWQHEYGDSTAALTSTFANTGGSSFTVAGPEIGADSMLLGAGFTAQWNERVSLFLYYDGQFGATNYLSDAISGGFRVAF